MMNRRNRAVWTAVIVGTLALGSVAALGGDLWVKAPEVNIFGGMGALYGTVGQAKKGDKLTVLDQQGKWYHVKYGTVEGYVFADSISPKEIGPDSTLTGPEVNTGMSTGTAAKGLEPQADQYAASKNLDPKPLDNLILFNTTISMEEWEAFVAAGKIGPDKPKARP